MKRLYATMAIILLSGGLTLAQGVGVPPQPWSTVGVPPGVNPSNSQDLTNRSNPQDLTLPGASNTQDLVRGPALPKATSRFPDLGRMSPLSLSLGHTHTIKPIKKLARRKPSVSGVEGQ
jgi:hypothetical protein